MDRVYRERALQESEAEAGAGSSADRAGLADEADTRARADRWQVSAGRRKAYSLDDLRSFGHRGKFVAVRTSSSPERRFPSPCDRARHPPDAVGRNGEPGGTAGHSATLRVPRRQRFLLSQSATAFVHYRRLRE